MEYFAANKIPQGSYIVLDGVRFDYNATERDVVDTSTLLQMYEDEEISRESFLDMIKPDAKVVATKLGADLAADLITKDVGSTLDLRLTELPVEQAKDEYVNVERIVKTRRRLSKEGATRKQLAGKPKIGRRIKVRK